MKECPECGREFETQKALNSHMGHAHPREKTIDCPYCEESFASEGALSSHLQNAHEDEMDNECPYCDRKFRRVRGLRLHIAKVHQEKLEEFDRKKGVGGIGLPIQTAKGERLRPSSED